MEPSNSPSGAPSAFDPVLDYAKSLLIQGIHQSLLFGFSSSISDDGSLLAVGAMDSWNEFGEATGAVYLYSLDGFITNVVSSSQPKPFEILYGQSTGDDSGNAVALSQDGAHLVVGSRAENKGKGAIRIYQIIDDSVTLKYVFAGENPSGRAGWSVAVSDLFFAISLCARLICFKRPTRVIDDQSIDFRGWKYRRYGCNQGRVHRRWVNHDISSS